MPDAHQEEPQLKHQDHTPARASKEAVATAAARCAELDDARRAFVKAPKSEEARARLQEALKIARAAHDASRPDGWYRKGRRVPAAEKQRGEALAKAHLALLLPPGSLVLTNLKHVSRSGMMRSIQVLVVADGEVEDISRWVSDALGWTWSDGAVKVSGCGMDAGFHLVNSLSYSIHGTKDADMPDPSSLPEGKRYGNARAEARPGYTLGQRWL